MGLQYPYQVLPLTKHPSSQAWALITHASVHPTWTPKPQQPSSTCRHLFLPEQTQTTQTGLCHPCWWHKSDQSLTLCQVLLCGNASLTCSGSGLLCGLEASPHSICGFALALLYHNGFGMNCLGNVGREKAGKEREESASGFQIPPPHTHIHTLLLPSCIHLIYQEDF